MQEYLPARYHAEIDQATESLMVWCRDEYNLGVGADREIFERYHNRRDLTARFTTAFPGGDTLAVRAGWRMPQHCTNRLRDSGVENVFERATGRVQAIIVQIKDFGEEPLGQSMAPNQQLGNGIPFGREVHLSMMAIEKAALYEDFHLGIGRDGGQWQNRWIYRSVAILTGLE